MFEKVILRRSDSGVPITIGELSEALLFYQNVHIILDFSSLSNLIETIGMPSLLSLIGRPNVSAVYCEEIPATKTDTCGGKTVHEFIALIFSGDKQSGDIKKRKKRLEHLLYRYGYEKRKARRLVDRFRRLVPLRDLTSDFYIDGGVIRSAWPDLINHDYVYEAIRRVLMVETNTEIVSNELIFRVEANFPTFQVCTNIDFKSLNSDLRLLSPNSSEISVASLINHILFAHVDTVLASHYGGEFYTSDLESKIIRLKHRGLLKRIGIEKAEIETFNEVAIDTAPSLRETMNSGQRSFNEFLILLDKSHKFKEWIKGVNPDEKFIKAYFQEMASQGWISSLPAKTLRYMLGLAITAVQPMAGLAETAADTLITDQLLGGWRPNHFINKKLKPFLK